ncbi:hypothetical protein [Lyngbya sp. CCY1209]|uniref:hypothetical protein n=1 Tax=Lyngbya sp. CCY1209 TaxID=2886103 RepID=UPI002D2018D0|nr:hypothetical protein [Lyngbya sp. CCY1209]MEB3883781.1 hypothetical protein [Lyngbya sp. CCY1209]
MRISTNQLGLSAIAFLGLLAIASAVYPPAIARATAFNIVCEFKYRIGGEEQSWVLDSASGTSRSQARGRRKQRIEYLEQKAAEAGEEFEAIYLFCEDPWGNDGDFD